MIEVLRIAGFKSVKDLSMRCKRVNVLIGPPNSGKSNILEALGMFSFLYYGPHGPSSVSDFVRLETLNNLFFDEDLTSSVNIACDNTALELRFVNEGFEGGVTRGDQQIATLSGGGNQLNVSNVRYDDFKSIRFYRFQSLQTLPGPDSDYLKPPYGINLLNVLLSHKDLRSSAGQLFQSLGLALVLRPQEQKLEVQKTADGVVISYPYSLTSETLRRVVFYLAAIQSNKNSTIIFEEPEAYALPYYTKQLAELIALDAHENQYFISTHNPYFLLPLLEKSSPDAIGVNVATYKKYETHLRQLSTKELSDLDTIDIFSNLERL